MALGSIPLRPRMGDSRTQIPRPPTMMLRLSVSALLLPLALLHGLDGQDAKALTDQEVDPSLRAAVDEIIPQVEALRGLEFLRPVGLRVASVEDLQAYMKVQLEDSLPPGELEAIDTVVKLMGLLPADTDLLALQNELIESQVGGFYDPATDTFSLMESLVGSGLAKVILAHELTHALDDQHYDLDAGMTAREGNSDVLWAYQAVIEGSATAVGNRWAMEQLQSPDGGLTMADLREAEEIGADVLERTPVFLTKTLLGAYLRGSAFLARTDSILKATMTMPPVEDLNRGFEQPPLSSEQVLHPSAYWLEDKVDAPQEVTLDLAALPAGSTLLMQDTFGELQLNFFVEPMKARKPPKGQMGILGASYSCKAVKGWGGDSWALIGQGEGRVLVLRTLWDSEVDALEFDAALAEKELAEHITGSLKRLSVVRGAGLEFVYHHRRIGVEVRVVLAAGVGAQVSMAIADAIAPSAH
ncbi:MAG: hypothetical protein ACI82F_003727 [Planctomycetota bacterium]|jgi:hypothetical protein